MPVKLREGIISPLATIQQFVLHQLRNIDSCDKPFEKKYQKPVLSWIYLELSMRPGIQPRQILLLDNLIGYYQIESVIRGLVSLQRSPCDSTVGLTV